MLGDCIGANLRVTGHCMPEADYRLAAAIDAHACTLDDQSRNASSITPPLQSVSRKSIAAARV